MRRIFSLIDLIVQFATLGEYHLERVEQPPPYVKPIPPRHPHARR